MRHTPGMNPLPADAPAHVGRCYNPHPGIYDVVLRDPTATGEPASRGYPWLDIYLVRPSIPDHLTHLDCYPSWANRWGGCCFPPGRRPETEASGEVLWADLPGPVRLVARSHAPANDGRTLYSHDLHRARADGGLVDLFLDLLEEGGWPVQSSWILMTEPGPLSPHWIPDDQLRRLRDKILDLTVDPECMETARMLDPDGLDLPGASLGWPLPRNPAGRRHPPRPSLEMNAHLSMLAPWGMVRGRTPAATHRETKSTNQPNVYRELPWPIHRILNGWPIPPDPIEELLASGETNPEERSIIADHAHRILPEADILEMETQLFGGPE